MVDGRRFEDNISVEELMNKNKSKELLAKLYIQALKTNGTVKGNEKRIIVLEEDNKHTIKTKWFITGSAIIGFLIILFNVIDLFVR